MNGSLREEGSRRRTTEAATVNHTLTHMPIADVQDEYSGGSVPLMALEYTKLREMGWRDGERLTEEEGLHRRTTEAGRSITRSLTSCSPTSRTSIREAACH